MKLHDIREKSVDELNALVVDMKKELFSLYLMPASPTREKVLKLSFVLLTEVVVVLDPMAKEKPPKNSALISLLIFIEYPP